MTVDDFIKTYADFEIGRRKNQPKLHVKIVRKGTGERLYSDCLSCGTRYVSTECKLMEISCWFFDYKNKEIILSVVNNQSTI